MAPVAGLCQPAVKRRATGLGDLQTDAPIISGTEKVFLLVESRRFELLTSCLQIGLILSRTGRELGGKLPTSDRD